MPAAVVPEPDLDRVIPAFYARVRADAQIGPLFNAAIDDWDHHLEQLIAFWSSVMNTTGRYKGSPMAAHLKHKAAIAPEMFDRWLELWGEVTAEYLPATQAAALRAKAANIAESLKLALFFRPSAGAPPRPYRITAEWDEATLPAAVRNRHNTKAGVWGLLRVQAGAADLVFEEPARRLHVTPGFPAVIPPQAWHHVELDGPVRLQVEFYREPPLAKDAGGL